MYNVYVKRIFVITEIVRMNAGVSSEKEKVKESQSRRVTPPLDTHYRVPGWGRHKTSLPLHQDWNSAQILQKFHVGTGTSKCGTGTKSVLVLCCFG